MKTPVVSMDKVVKDTLRPAAYFHRVDDESDYTTYQIHKGGKFLGVAVDSNYIVSLFCHPLGNPDVYKHEGVERSFVWKMAGEMLVFDHVDRTLSIMDIS